MLVGLHICGGGSALDLEPLRYRNPELPPGFVRAGEARAHAPSGPGRRGEVVAVPAAAWSRPELDPVTIDTLVRQAEEAHGRVTLEVLAGGRDAACACAEQLLTRYQRLLPLGERAEASGGGVRFADVLRVHRGAHDLSKPLVAADYDHALDCWRWLLRLDREVAFATQVAALFHDIERTVSEADVRIEQHAADYAAFKRAHTRRGAQMTARALHELGAQPALVDDVVAILSDHEGAAPAEVAPVAPWIARQRALLNDADALSFFSLNSCGFVAYYGPAHARTKVAYSWRRLSPRGQRALADVRLRADIAALLAEARATTTMRAAS